MNTKKTLFFGSATALVTPFKDGEIDYSAFEGLIEFQLSQETDAIVILGTTGEAPTIYEDERNQLVAFAKEKINGRVPLIVGTGSNATSVAVRYTKTAQELGADGCLVVTPYYNKATTNGLIEHFKAIAESVSIPIIMYNVPSRTGVSLPIDVYGALSDVHNIVGVKEASGNLGYLTELIQKHGNAFDIYTGCDELILPALALGGKGVVSVVSNLTPQLVHKLCEEFSQGNVRRAREIQLYLNPLIKELFYEVNPIPVKNALCQMGLCQNEYRLPLCPSSREEKITDILKKYSLLA